MDRELDNIQDDDTAHGASQAPRKSQAGPRRVLNAERIEVATSVDYDLAVFKLHENSRRAQVLPFVVCGTLLLVLALGTLGVPGALAGLRSLPQMTPATVASYLGQAASDAFVGLAGASGAPLVAVLHPQYLAASLAGAALAACGAVYQAVFKNVLAGPSTLGAIAGGTLGGFVYLLLFAGAVGVDFFYGPQRTLFMFCGACAGVALTMGVAYAAGRGKPAVSAMLIGGMILSAVAENVVMLGQYAVLAGALVPVNVDAGATGGLMADFGRLTMGTVDGVGGWRLAGLGVPVALLCAALAFCAGKANLFSLSADEATSSGLDVRRWRICLVGVGTLLTAVVMSFCGGIDFVGFMMPLVMRRAVGPDLRRLLPYSMAAGAIFLMLVQAAVEVSGVMYLSAITGPVGCVVIIAVLLRGGGRHAAAEQRAASIVEV